MLEYMHEDDQTCSCVNGNAACCHTLLPTSVTQYLASNGGFPSKPVGTFQVQGFRYVKGIVRTQPCVTPGACRKRVREPRRKNQAAVSCQLIRSSGREEERNVDSKRPKGRRKNVLLERAALVFY